MGGHENFFEVTIIQIHRPSLKLAAHLWKVDGWKMKSPFEMALFSGTFAVSFREGTKKAPSNPPSFHKHTPNGPGGSACASGTSASWSFTVQPLALREPTQGILTSSIKLAETTNPPRRGKFWPIFWKRVTLLQAKLEILKQVINFNHQFPWKDCS